MDFGETVGKEFKFYGVSETTFKIGPHTFEVSQTVQDSPCIFQGSITSKKDEKLEFLHQSLATVRVEQCTDYAIDGYELVDVNTGYSWLVFGTNVYDNYYPDFVFFYNEQAKHRGCFNEPG